MVAIGQTITVVNKSGKVVGTSKHLVNVFKEAKSAYSERKAEIKAQRKIEFESKEKERKARKQLEALNLGEDDDDRSSRASSRRGSETGKSIKRKPVPGKDRVRVRRSDSDSFYANDRSHDRDTHRPSPLRNGSSVSLNEEEPRIGELTRRHTDGMQLRRQKESRRRASLDDIDMDLAYGEYLPQPGPESKREDEIELQEKMSGLQRLLDEGNCIQHSVTAMIDNLQKNPDALAAVALTLAEISNLVAKMGPGALMTMKSSFPVIVALLASPQFAIAAGVGVGVTIIAFGGYKIIKKIKARDERRLLESGIAVPEEAESRSEEMDELREIDHIERWRRGIADEQANSLGTSIDGMFVTPQATRTLIEEGKLTEADFKPVSTKEEKKSRKKKTKSEVSAKTSKSRSKSGETKSKKEPSGLRMLFKGSS